MLIDYHQHEEPPPGPMVRLQRGFPHGQQWLIFMGALLAMIVVIHLLYTLFPPRIRRLAHPRPIPIDSEMEKRIARDLPPAAQSTCRTAVEAYRHRRWEAALHAFQRIRQRGATVPELNLLVGITFLEQKRPAAAIAELKAAQARLQGTERAYCDWNLAQAYLLREQPQQAIALLVALSKTDGEFAELAARQRDSVQALWDAAH